MSVSLPEELGLELRRYARIHDRSVANVVRLALRRLIDDAEQEQL